MIVEIYPPNEPIDAGTPNASALIPSFQGKLKDTFFTKQVATFTILGANDPFKEIEDLKGKIATLEQNYNSLVLQIKDGTIQTCSVLPTLFECHDGNIMYKDTCGIFPEIPPKETCSCGCTGTACTACPPAYVCSTSNCYGSRAKCSNTSCFGNEVLQTCINYYKTC